jgi:DNA-binding Lrp family transcriptional regulator
MSTAVKIDEIDEKILRSLIRDARTRLKDIAEECNVTSVSVLNRMKRLKKLGVITGATLYIRPDLLNLPIIANIGINLDPNHANESKIVKCVDEQTNLVEPSASIGKYDFCALVYAKDVNELDKTVYALKRCRGITKIVVNIYSSKPHFLFENINLQPKAGDIDG